MLPESQLISLVKQNHDSNALTELVNMHTGIYFTVVNSYARAYPDVIKVDDLSDDKMYYIYRFILDYKDDRGAKLSTYIGDRTDYLCKGILKKDDRDPLACGQPLTQTLADDVIDTFSTTHGASITLADTSLAAHPEESVNTEIALEDIVKTAASETVCKDPRFTTILSYRHLSSDPLTWRQIGEKMHLSHEGVRKIYSKNMKAVKRALGRTRL